MEPLSKWPALRGIWVFTGSSHASRCLHLWLTPTGDYTHWHSYLNTSLVDLSGETLQGFAIVPTTRTHYKYRSGGLEQTDYIRDVGLEISCEAEAQGPMTSIILYLKINHLLDLPRKPRLRASSPLSVSALLRLVSSKISRLP